MEGTFLLLSIMRVALQILHYYFAVAVRRQTGKQSEETAAKSTSFSSQMNGYDLGCTEDIPSDSQVFQLSLPCVFILALEQ